MLSDLWALVSSHSTITGAIAAALAVILVLISQLQLAKTVLTVIAAVAFLGTETGHPVIVGVIALIIACVVFYYEPKVYTGHTYTSSGYSGSGYHSGGYGSSIDHSTNERSFTQGGSTGCGIGGSFCGCGSGR